MGSNGVYPLDLMGFTSTIKYNGIMMGLYIMDFTAMYLVGGLEAWNLD